jgi:hypothetical protein
MMVVGLRDEKYSLEVEAQKTALRAWENDKP